MPMQVLLTTDTELSSALHEQGVSAADNYARSIEGRCRRGRSWGVPYQLEQLRHWGLKTVFFVDPMPALVYGPQIIADIVGPLRAQGHEVQLHIHTEWLDHVTDSPVGDRSGHNMADFSLDDQKRLLSVGRDLLTDAGVPPPTAFRAGNYGANDDTLRALAALGFTWDSSFNPAQLGGDCQIDLPPDTRHVHTHRGAQICPISVIEDRSGCLRHAQLCALSAREMRAALHHAVATDAQFFNIVNHSFELFVRKARRGNWLLARRFRALCRTIAQEPGMTSGGFRELERRDLRRGARALPASLTRRTMRMAEQAGSRLLIEDRPYLPSSLPTSLSKSLSSED